MFEIGRVCIKTAGREAGRFCIVVAKDKEKDFLIITGPKEATKVRRRKCNYRHLEPTPFKLEIKENATDDDVLKAYEKEDIYAKLKLVKPTEEQVKVSEERKERRKEEKSEEKKEEEKETKHEEKHEHEKHEKKEEHKKHEHKEEKPKKARAKKAGAKKAGKK